VTASSGRRFASVRETVATYPKAFTSEASLRWQIFSNKAFSQAVVRHVGRKVLLDLDAFERWLDSQGGNTREHS
jgi:hypothetical protein